jgi:heme oxygenase
VLKGARAALRHETEAIHLRLHQHRLLKPLAAGKIDRSGYQDLLMRLYGFHAPLELALVSSVAALKLDLAMDRRLRVALLRRDMRDLGLDERAIADLPTNDSMPALASEGDLLGALYVREGSTLGGKVLARHLDAVLGLGVLDGRRFLAGDGEDGPLWRSCGEAIEAAALCGHLPAMIATANATFLAFEAWLDGAHQKDKIDGEDF